MRSDLMEDNEEFEATAARDDPAGFLAHRRPAHEPSQVFSVRIPVEKLEQLRRTAGELHTTPSALLRGWAIEHLERGEPDLRELVRSVVREELAHATH